MYLTYLYVISIHNISFQPLSVTIQSTIKFSPIQFWLKLHIINKIMQSNKVHQMVYGKRFSKKQSVSSIKLPIIPKKQLRSHQSSVNKINANDISNRSIASPDFIKSSSKHSIEQSRVQHSYKKSKSRAEPLRIKTQGVEKELTSYQSPVNAVNDQQLDHTLQNFIKDVQKNKLFILKQRNRKISQNKYVNQTLQHQTSHQYKRKRLMHYKNSDESQIFQKLQNIISKNGQSSCELNLDEVKKALRFQKITKIIKKIHPQKSLHNVKQEIMNQVANSTNNLEQKKCENNYFEWRRVNIVEGQEKQLYKKSTFETQSHRIGQLTLKTESTISRYLQNRQIILDLRNKMLKLSS